ncbi:lysylphosphatidylglycerol synthase transmembrane domain-containing protein [Salinisphaera sp. SPP-AMP-43]|uniref:lysylphosphatidylglycerol synthase transmembrane domain-containing protein n=1 Tax=Salinisphaera sp. SPP-AMP-43 TaxID=3121288 RepID=UPI003C6EA065
MNARPPTGTMPAGPRRRLKSGLKSVLKLLVSAGLIAFLFTQLDVSSALHRCVEAQPGFLAAALALLLTQGFISALKWHVILQADHCRLPLLRLWKTYLIGMFLSLLLPTSFGGDIYRVYAIRHQAPGLGKGASSVLFDRLTGLTALVTLAVIGSLCLTDSRFIAPSVAIYLVLITIGLLLTSDRALSWLRPRSTGRLRFLVALLESFNAYRRDRRCLLLVAAISLLFQTNIVVINALYCAALGIDVSFWQLLMVVPLVYLTEVLPISINGLGVRESAFVFFFQSIGQSAEAGLAVALLVVVFRYASGLIGGGLLLWDWLRNGRDFSAAEPQADPGQASNSPPRP